MQYVILGQDQPIVESQRPEELPVDLTAEMHVKGADAGTVEYRRWLISIANGEITLAPHRLSVDPRPSTRRQRHAPPVPRDDVPTLRSRAGTRGRYRWAS